MNLRIYRYAKAEELSDSHKVLAWFLTQMFREAGENQVITLDMYDFKYLYRNMSGTQIDMEQLNESAMGRMFAFADLGPRMAVSIRQEAIAKRYTGRKLGVEKFTITDDTAIKVGIYLHAALNFMDNWFTDEDFNIFAEHEYKGRFAPEAKKTRSIHDRFYFENLLSNPRNAGRRENENG